MRLPRLGLLLLIPPVDLILLLVLFVLWPWYWTVGGVLLSGMLGLWVLGQGRRRTTLARPHDPLGHGLRVFAALLLIWPGPLGDLIGLGLLLPPTRRWIVRGVISWLAGRLLSTPLRSARSPSNVIDVTAHPPRFKRFN